MRTVAGKAVKFVQARNYTRVGKRQIDLIVLHDMEYPERSNGAEWCAGFFAGPGAPKASAHYCVDNDSVVQCVKDGDVAWHAPGANHNGIGIEHAGYAAQSRAQWDDIYTRAELKMSAKLVAQLCRDYNIPVRYVNAAGLRAKQRGITTHLQVTLSGLSGGDHRDPGPNFPILSYIRRVRAELAALKPKPKGAK